MNPIDDHSNEHFSWADFERLDELCETMADPNQGQPENSLPDATYRQVIGLNEALMIRAQFLYQKEQELEQQKQDLDLLRKNLESSLFQQSKDAVEARLDRLLGSHKSSHAAAKASDASTNLSYASTETPEVPTEASQADSDVIDFVPVDDEWLTEVAPMEPNETFGVETPADSQIQTTQSRNSEREVSRLQQSAEDLRAKSEVISAVFVELDQMVRELGRQQELLAKLPLSKNSDHSTQELQRVSDKLKRRFHRLSRQINFKS